MYLPENIIISITCIAFMIPVGVPFSIMFIKKSNKGAVGKGLYMCFLLWLFPVIMAFMAILDRGPHVYIPITSIGVLKYVGCILIANSPIGVLYMCAGCLNNRA